MLNCHRYNPITIPSIALMFAFLWFILPARVTDAQQLSQDTGTSTPYFILSVIPDTPRSGDSVTATLVIVTPPIPQSSISWLLDGKTQTTAGTSTSFNFRAPIKERGYFDLGVIVTANGLSSSQTQRIILNPLDDTLTIQQRLTEQLHRLERQYGPADAPLFPSAAGTDGQSSGTFDIISDIQNPRPFDTVNLRITSVSFNPDQALIEWFQDGKKISEGVGQTIQIVRLGTLGTQTRVRARITAQGTVYQDELILTPFSAALYWWADTAAPYWYKGKSLATKDNLVYVSMFVPTGLSEPKNIIYNWILNNENQLLNSGLNKQIFNFRPRLSRLSDSILVRIKNAGGTFASEQALAIPNVEPEIRFCVIDIFSGCSKGAGNASARAGDAIDIKAAPFYFGKTESTLLKYAWSVGGKSPKAVKVTRPELLTVKLPTGIQGTLPIQTDVQSLVSKISVLGSFTLTIQP